MARRVESTSNVEAGDLDSDSICPPDEADTPGFYVDPRKMFNATGAGRPGRIPMPGFGSPEEFRTRRNHLVASIFKSHRRLADILEKHEAAIHKRWAKKTKEQKRKVLLSAWGTNMAVNHRPDFEAYRKLGKRINDKEAASKYREEFMWPFINQEDLTKPKMLLLFLNARGRSPPADFAGADYEAMHVGIVTHTISRAFLNEHVMLFTGRYGEANYGELLKWDDHPDAFEWLHTRRHMQPADGLLILESQDRTLSFLVDCAEQILHNIPPESLRDYPIQPEPASGLERESDVASLASTVAKAPYRVPKDLSFARIESLLAAKCDAAEDHLWLLREDPSYFADLILDSSEHKQDMILDTRGLEHPAFRFGRDELFWGRVINGEVNLAYIRIEERATLQKYAEELKTLEKQYSSKIKPEGDLPEDYLYSILRFREMLLRFAKRLTRVLKIAFTASPPWRIFFERNPEDNPTATKSSTTQKAHPKPGRSAQELLFLVQTLWEDGNDLFVLRMTNVLDELQRFIDLEPEAKSMITSYIAAQISDLSIMGECLREVDSYQPWANMYEQLMLDRKDKIQAEFKELSVSWARTVNAIKGSDGVLARYGTPTNNRFQYPVDQRRNRENTEAMQRAEQKLDAFWHKVDELMHRNAGDLQGTSARQLLLQPRLLRRTSEWADSTTTKAGKQAVMEDLVKPLSELYFDLEHNTESTVSQKENRRPKAKQRSPGIATSPLPVTTPAESTKANPQDQPTFAVDSRSLKVFKTLFHPPSPGSSPGEVPWTDFLHAMLATGFHAEKLYGSAWHFRPSSRLTLEASILFHEPHPPGKIPFRSARRMGKRLARKYGWSGGLFVLAEKPAWAR